MRRHFPQVLAAFALVLGMATAVAAQSALDRLERQIRERVANPTDHAAQAAAAVPTPPTPSPSEAINTATEYFGMLVDDQRDRGRGVRVVDLYRGGPADKAGIRKQDLVTVVGGVRVRQLTDMADMLDAFMPGQAVAFELLRDGRPVRVQVKMADRRLAATLPAAGPEPVPLPRSKAALKPPAPDESTRIEELERRVEQLERRVADLEEQLAGQKKH